VIAKQVPSYWRIALTRLIRAEMVKRGFTYADLSAHLQRFDINQSEANLRNKISKGIMGADLLLQILVAMEVAEIRTSDITTMLDDIAKK
jgi:hypothetical protein